MILESIALHRDATGPSLLMAPVTNTATPMQHAPMAVPIATRESSATRVGLYYGPLKMSLDLKRPGPTPLDFGNGSGDLARMLRIRDIEGNG